MNGLLAALALVAAMAVLAAIGAALTLWLHGLVEGRRARQIERPEHVLQLVAHLRAVDSLPVPDGLPAIQRRIAARPSGHSWLRLLHHGAHGAPR
ncbi:hypothetical protein [Spongiactinospora sp. TRM90649]|uniref:hypothetical protein n=1 Tax=Spongiactinospora sp. TRM90649 TaxID=3031114 RepID=UPI0023F858C4|nr:hypothetical protein [Spongiactinospora sp. TRM90649]MDF5758573.1 hypothetical protein [Spongiactinospora sp. TRM90649]